jgi:hypothetical protein
LYQSSLTLHRFSGGFRIADPVAWRFVYVLDGTADANGESLAAGSGLLLEPGEAPALTGHACVIVARVAPRSGS